jgi:peptide deformylase
MGEGNRNEFAFILIKRAKPWTVRKFLKVVVRRRGDVNLLATLEPDNAAKPPVVLINPKVIRTSKELCTGEEGCLSVPGVYLDVVRPAAIELSFKDENGRPQKLQASDLLARCILHEMDHLAGVMFVDRVTNQLALNQALQKEGFSAKDVHLVHG